jgi:hypothetical protein
MLSRFGFHDTERLFYKGLPLTVLYGQLARSAKYGRTKPTP